MAVYTYLYDEMFDPAMPTVDVQIIAPDSQLSSATVQALIDSGSDGPANVVEILESAA